MKLRELHGCVYGGLGGEPARVRTPPCIAVLPVELRKGPHHWGLGAREGLKAREERTEVCMGAHADHGAILPHRGPHARLQTPKEHPRMLLWSPCTSIGGPVWEYIAMIYTELRTNFCTSVATYVPKGLHGALGATQKKGAAKPYTCRSSPASKAGKISRGGRAEP